MILKNIVRQRTSTDPNVTSIGAVHFYSFFSKSESYEVMYIYTYVYVSQWF